MFEVVSEELVKEEVCRRWEFVRDEQQFSGERQFCRREHPGLICRLYVDKITVRVRPLAGCVVDCLRETGSSL